MPPTEWLILALALLGALLSTLLKWHERRTRYRFWLHMPVIPGRVPVPTILLATEETVSLIRAVRPVLGPYATYQQADRMTIAPMTYHLLEAPP